MKFEDITEEQLNDLIRDGCLETRVNRGELEYKITKKGLDKLRAKNGQYKLSNWDVDFLEFSAFIFYNAITKQIKKWIAGMKEIKRE